LRKGPPAGSDPSPRDVIVARADLNFWVEKTDATLGAVKGSKSGVTLTVTVAPRGRTQVVVRANAQRGMSPVEDLET
jgi:hypothetical protein